MARRTIYEPENADAIVEAVASGSTIQAACDAVSVRRTTFLGWAKADRCGLSVRLAEAKLKARINAQAAPAAAGQGDRFADWLQHRHTRLAERSAPAKASEAAGASAPDPRQEPPHEPGLVATLALNPAAVRILLAALEAAAAELRRGL